MLGIMFQKSWAKKWMFLCLLLGSILLTATVVSFPIYQSAVFDRMLRGEFINSLSETGDWPAALSLETTVNLREDKERIAALEEQAKNIGDKLGVTTTENLRLYRLICSLELASGRRDVQIDPLRPGVITGLPEHATMQSGEMYSEDGLAEDGSIEVVISRSCMAKSNLLLGDVLRLTLSDDSVVSFKITGVFDTNQDRHYWEFSSDHLENLCLMQEEQFRKHFLSEDFKLYYSANFRHLLLFEYESLTADQVGRILSGVADTDYQGDTCLQLLKTFQRKQPLISTTLFFLEIPVLVLLAAFLFMVSGQMYQLEKNEISVIKSRGSSAFQIFRLYLYQNLFLTALGSALGLPLGFYFVRILGSASNFLEFNLHRNLEVQFEPELWFYVGTAAFFSVLIMTLPAIRHSKVSIVHLKQKKQTRKRPLWEYFCLDFICLGIGGYGYYNFTRNESQVIENVLGEQSMDPLLYLASSLFIVGAGLLFLRLQPLLVKLVYMIGKRFWRPASYASFLDHIKNGKKQQFIMLFLILTVSLGTFYATVARTILQNSLNNMEYLDGTDIIIKEIWKNNSAVVEAQEQRAAQALNQGVSASVDRLRYYETDFTKYTALKADVCTKVYYASPEIPDPSAQAYISLDDNKKLDITFMGIHTKEFGESTRLDQGLNEKHYYTYLNTLAGSPDGVLVSRNFQTEMDYKAGDQIWCTCQLFVKGHKAGSFSARYKILDFVDYWPGFAPNRTSVSNAGSVVTEPNYLVVANASSLKNASSSVVIPYEVWISLGEDLEAADVAKWINDNDIKVEKYMDRTNDLKKTIEDPLLQGTNGILTMSFLVMILLCAVGYLIYWIMSIRSRELIFGTLRAFGMHKSELFHMLIMEQFFSGILSLLAGMGIGKLASRMYVPLLQTAYAASNQVLPIKLLTNPQDMERLYGTLTVMMALCLIVLALLVLRLNITKALKLGEE